MTLADKVKVAGVVGAGGGGFPTHVKLAAKADTVIANGAECEPLLHKDAVVMEEQAAELVQGMQLAMRRRRRQGRRHRHQGQEEARRRGRRRRLQGHRVRVHLLGDYYPAGDEYDLVYAVTGRLIPPAGIPIQVGVVVNNVETLVNIAAAADGQAGHAQDAHHRRRGEIARRPSPCPSAPPSASARRRGRLTTDDPVLCIGGLMMGETTDNLDTPDHQDHHRRGDSAAQPSRDGAQAQAHQGAGQDRQVRLRPVPLLHRVLPALSARLRGRAAPGDAQPGLHRHRRGVLEPVGRAVLFLRPVHAVRLPGGTVSQGSLRRFEGRDAPRSR